jgi:hypothetical protein
MPTTGLTQPQKSFHRQERLLAYPLYYSPQRQVIRHDEGGREAPAILAVEVAQ